MSIIILPGLGGSGAEHWQSRWQAADPAMRRFQPSSWDAPDLADWIAALDRAATGDPPVLVAHSLACLLVAHWRGPARAALLVAVPDPDAPGFPAEAASFRDPPMAPLPFPALVVGSRDDPYATPDRARGFARAWGAEFVEAGALGHINAASGIGDWPQGKALLAGLLRR